MDTKYTVDVLVPVFNEENTVEEILTRILAQEIPGIEIQRVVVVDDLSTDNTWNKLESISQKYPGRIELVQHPRNYGKGRCIRTGMDVCQSELVIVQDGDLEYDPENYKDLLKPFLYSSADVVYGSRFRGGKEVRVLYFWHTVGNKFLTFLSNVFTNLNLTDMETGAKVFRRDIFNQINLCEDRFGFEPEVTAKIAKLKLKIYEVGITYFGRTYEDGKKITWRDGFKAIYCILRYSMIRS